MGFISIDQFVCSNPKIIVFFFKFCSFLIIILYVSHYHIFFFSGKNRGIEERFNKMRGMYTKLRDEHVGLLRKVRQSCLWN